MNEYYYHSIARKNILSIIIFYNMYNKCSTFLLKMLYFSFFVCQIPHTIAPSEFEKFCFAYIIINYNSEIPSSHVGLGGFICCNLWTSITRLVRKSLFQGGLGTRELNLMLIRPSRSCLLCLLESCLFLATPLILLAPLVSFNIFSS